MVADDNERGIRGQGRDHPPDHRHWNVDHARQRAYLNLPLFANVQNLEAPTLLPPQVELSDIDLERQ